MMGSSGLFGRLEDCVLGSATATPWWSMGAVTMKMISSTSMTSTSGVTLMSAMWSNGSFLGPEVKTIASPFSHQMRPDARPRPGISVPSKAGAGPGAALRCTLWREGRAARGTCGSAPPAPGERLGKVPLRQVQELEREVVHRGAEQADLPHEVVVRHQRGDRGGEAGGGVDERLGYSRRHRDDRRRAGHADRVERLHDSPHGAEDADERARRGRGGEEGQVLGQARDLRSGGPLERPLDSADVLDQEARGRRGGRDGVIRARGFDLLVELGVARFEQGRQRRVGELRGDRVYLREALGLAEELQEPV